MYFTVINPANLPEIKRFDRTKVALKENALGGGLGKIPEVEEEEEEEAEGTMINDNVGMPDEETIQDSPNLSSQGKIHPSGELNARHHSDTDSYLQRRKVDFNVPSTFDENDAAVSADGDRVKIGPPMNQSEGAENGMDGNSPAESIRRVIDSHDSVQSDVTTIEREEEKGARR